MEEIDNNTPVACGACNWLGTYGQLIYAHMAVLCPECGSWNIVGREQADELSDCRSIKKRLKQTQEELGLTKAEWEAKFGVAHPGPGYTEVLKIQEHRLKWELLPAPRPKYEPLEEK